MRRGVLPLPGFETNRVCPVCDEAFFDASKNRSKKTCSNCCRDSLYYAEPIARNSRLLAMRINILKSQGVQVDGETRARLYGALYETGECEACGSSPGFGTKGLHIDHNHSTLQIRGVLCQGCNLALGLVQENVERLLSLIGYVTGTYG